MIEAYKTNVSRLAGTDYREVSHKVRAIYKELCSKTKRKPYVRSAYFNKEKVFLDYFWQHLSQKNKHDRFRRLKYYGCAIDLITYSHIKPVIIKNPNNQSEIFYRFAGITKQKEQFIVQIKEDIRKFNKHFISVFPL